MTIRFHPPQLKVARNAGTFCRLASELAGPDEVRVVQVFPDRRTRVVPMTHGAQPVSVELPHNWLYQELTDDEVRSPLAELLLATRMSSSRGARLELLLKRSAGA